MTLSWQREQRDTFSLLILRLKLIGKESYLEQVRVNSVR